MKLEKEYTITLSESELWKVTSAILMQRKYYKDKSEDQGFENLDRYMYSLIVDECDELLEKMNNL